MYRQTLYETAQRIFEDAAFALVDPPDETTRQERHFGVELSAVVAFNGEFSGLLVITIPQELARSFAANMLGIEEDDPAAALKSDDAVGEILNMICGNLLPAVAGTGPEFDIGAPYEISSFDLAGLLKRHPTKETTNVEIIVEDQPVQLALLLD